MKLEQELQLSVSLGVVNRAQADDKRRKAVISWALSQQIDHRVRGPAPS